MSDLGRIRSEAVCSCARWQSCARGSRARLPLAGNGYGRGACGWLMVRGGVTSQRDRAIAVSVEAAAPPRRAVGWFDRWVAQSMPVGAAALNIGAGANRSGDLKRVRSRAGRLVGVDPSDRIHHNMQVDERYQQSLEQFAPGHAGEFDLAFSVFVLEHVADPDGFARAAAQVLKPGGTLMGLTVNKWHYFGFTTWAATRLGVLRVAAGQGARRRGLPLPDRVPVQHRAAPCPGCCRRRVSARSSSGCGTCPGSTRRTCRRRWSGSRRCGIGPCTG